ncbi:Enoyl-CoA hydratase 2 peroxisomal [Zea mays]|uniref:Enoyl-CoA hydratase 2 peroxisomal n=1 Tax=Zea mays TaxID=4577 RepID=A0A1D6LRA8_MAIZE|nr:Enoyl-CoA hydratase 2 peroxisomal [Zea mays]
MAEKENVERIVEESGVETVEEAPGLVKEEKNDDTDGVMQEYYLLAWCWRVFRLFTTVLICYLSCLSSFSHFYSKFGTFCSMRRLDKAIPGMLLYLLVQRCNICFSVCKHECCYAKPNSFSLFFNKALLYRLSGDYNPLHSDLDIAQLAGYASTECYSIIVFIVIFDIKEVFGGRYNLRTRFTHPILHDLCTLGFAARTVIKSFCNGEPTAVKSIFSRFLLHVYPGETLSTEMWLDGQKVHYQTKANDILTFIPF